MLSRQTQESDVHKFSKHPRTAFCVDDCNQLYICVFSGRNRYFQSCDYVQMVTIIKKYIPNVVSIMNGDGGASSVLAYFNKDNFFELSTPCISTGSVASRIRDLNAMVIIEI